MTTRQLVNNVKDAAVVPDDAVQRGQDGLYAFVVAEGDKAQVRKIKVAYSGDGRSLIESGLTPGERVITGGLIRVQSGSPLAIKEANVASNNAQSPQPTNQAPVKAD